MSDYTTQQNVGSFIIKMMQNRTPSNSFRVCGMSHVHDTTNWLFKNVSLAQY